MIHSLLIVTVGKSVWARLLVSPPQGSLVASICIDALKYRRLEAGRKG